MFYLLVGREWETTKKPEKLNCYQVSPLSGTSVKIAAAKSK